VPVEGPRFSHITVHAMVGIIDDCLGRQIA